MYCNIILFVDVIITFSNEMTAFTLSYQMIQLLNFKRLLLYFIHMLSKFSIFYMSYPQSPMQYSPLAPYGPPAVPSTM